MDSRAPYGGMVTRAIAIVIDALLINAAAIAVSGAVLLLRSIFKFPNGHHGLAVTIGSVLFAAWVVGYFVLFWTTTGQTPGSRVMQIRVTGVDGTTRVGIRRALVRLVWMVLSIPFFWGYVPMLWTPRRRTMFDLVAGTVVVVTPAVPAVLPIAPAARATVLAAGSSHPALSPDRGPTGS
ncbi:MAG: RDD family protein [Solirubrobacteraceae bacterium]